MKIVVNSNHVELNQNQISIKDLLAERKFTFKLLIVKINDVLIKREDYATAIVKDGDKVDVIHLMSGG